MDLIETIREGDYLIRIFRDEYADSPRAPIILSDGKPVYPAQLSALRVKSGGRHGNMGDGDLFSDDREALDRGGWPLLARFVRCRDEAIIVVPLDVHEDWRSTLAIRSLAMGTENVDGYAVVTKAAWRELMGDDKYDAAKALEAIKAEVEEYNQWAEGDVYGYTITRKHDPECDDDDCAHDEDIESLHGMYGLDYARDEAMAATPQEAVRP